MKVLVTGGSGLIGHAVKSSCQQGIDAVYLSSKDGNLTSYDICQNLFDIHRPTHVIHLAAKVGGVLENSKFAGDFFYQNITMNCNVLECCRKFGVTNLVSVLGACNYPDKSGYALQPSDLHSGEPHSTSFGYAYAKRMLEVQSRAYNQQHGTKFSCVILNGVYGPYDNFCLTSSHAVAAIIRKIYEAKLSGNRVKLWGSGLAKREFTFVDDIGCALWWALLKRDDCSTINIGTDECITIRELASKVCEIMNYDYENLDWDQSAKTGQGFRIIDTTIFREKSGIRFLTLSHGLKLTIDWFGREYPNIKGIVV